MEHHHAQVVESRIRFAVGLTAVILVAELVGGYIANSLALMSDAGHVFTDILALGLSWYGVRQAARPPTARMSFGYHRVGIIIALVNALTLVAISVAIFYEAYRRFLQPPAVEGPLMFAIALVGLAANLIVVFALQREQKESINIRSAFIHAAGDALASIGVIVGAIVIIFTGWFWVDPTVSVVIGFIIAVAAWPIIREGINVLLEASPSSVNIDEVSGAIKNVAGVREIHDLHVWSIAPGINALSSHIVLDDQHVSEADKIVQQITALLREKYNMDHSTIQIECQACELAKGNGL